MTTVVLNQVNHNQGIKHRSYSDTHPMGNPTQLTPIGHLTFLDFMSPDIPGTQTISPEFGIQDYNAEHRKREQ
jgi:hypothetical protein